MKNPANLSFSELARAAGEAGDRAAVQAAAARIPVAALPKPATRKGTAKTAHAGAALTAPTHHVEDDE